MHEVIKEINEAVRKLNLSNSEIRLLDYDIGESIYYDCLEHFVKSGDRRCWWEDFKQHAFTINDLEFPFKHLDKYLPIDNDEYVWFMVEDNQEEYYPIYECKPLVIKEIIGECFGFEYYIISRNKKWLICENHHSRLIGSGDFT